MAKGALFVGFGAIIPGREKTASMVLGTAMEYLQRLREQGVLDGVETVLLEPHGGELEGFVLVKGDKDALARLRVDHEFIKNIVAVQLVHTKVGVVGAYAGAEMQALLSTWDDQETALLAR
jgi:hypothetical protein